MTKKRSDGEQRNNRKKKRYSKRQQFTEQMEQLCGPNYREKEVRR